VKIQKNKIIKINKILIEQKYTLFISRILKMPRNRVIFICSFSGDVQNVPFSWIRFKSVFYILSFWQLKTLVNSTASQNWWQNWLINNIFHKWRFLEIKSVGGSSLLSIFLSKRYITRPKLISQYHNSNPYTNIKFMLHSSD
jgi:hypothetical protein